MPNAGSRMPRALPGGLAAVAFFILCGSPLLAQDDADPAPVAGHLKAGTSQEFSRMSANIKLN